MAEIDRPICISEIVTRCIITMQQSMFRWIRDAMQSLADECVRVKSDLRIVQWTEVALLTAAWYRYFHEHMLSSRGAGEGEPPSPGAFKDELGMLLRALDYSPAAIDVVTATISAQAALVLSDGHWNGSFESCIEDDCLMHKHVALENRHDHHFRWCKRMLREYLDQDAELVTSYLQAAATYQQYPPQESEHGPMFPRLENFIFSLGDRIEPVWFHHIDPGMQRRYKQLVVPFAFYHCHIQEAFGSSPQKRVWINIWGGARFRMLQLHLRHNDPAMLAKQIPTPVAAAPASIYPGISSLVRKLWWNTPSRPSQLAHKMDPRLEQQPGLIKHFGIKCTECVGVAPIVGVGYRCLQCPTSTGGFIVCQQCWTAGPATWNTQTHHKSHKMQRLLSDEEQEEAEQAALDARRHASAVSGLQPAVFDPSNFPSDAALLRQHFSTTALSTSDARLAQLLSRMANASNADLESILHASSAVASASSIVQLSLMHHERRNEGSSEEEEEEKKLPLQQAVVVVERYIGQSEDEAEEAGRVACPAEQSSDSEASPIDTPLPEDRNLPLSAEMLAERQRQEESDAESARQLATRYAEIRQETEEEQAPK
jgi:hypothetical protein